MPRFTVLLAALALAGVAAAPAVAAPKGPASGTCVVKHVPNVAPSTLKVGVNIAEASSKAADKQARCGVVSSVVKSLARQGAERPMTVKGYACTPRVRNNDRVAWRCVWKGGSPKTTVELGFGWRYTNG
jgi:uncharacterized protein YggE